MKKVLFLAFAVMLSIPAFSQVKISDKTSQEVVANARLGVIKVIELQSGDTADYYLVSATTNKYDGNMTIHLGKTVEESITSLNAFIDLTETLKKKDSVYITDGDGDEFTITYTPSMGVKNLTFETSGYAGEAVISAAEFKKLIKDLGDD